MLVIFYCVFSKKQRPSQNSNSIDAIIQKLIPLFIERDGIVPQNIVKRVAILTILKENINIDLLDAVEDIIHGIATKDHGNYSLRKEVLDNHKTKNTAGLKNKLTLTSTKIT